MGSAQVKVTRAGNSRMLPVPADLARAAHAEQGDLYVVELVGEDIVYHRATSGAYVTGSGDARVGVVPAGRAMRLSGAASVPALDDWNF